MALALWDDEVGVHVHDWRAGHLVSELGVLDSFGPMGDGLIVDVERHDHVLAAVHAGEAVRLTRLLTHPDADGMDLTTRGTLERRTDDHGPQHVLDHGYT